MLTFLVFYVETNSTKNKLVINYIYKCIEKYPQDNE